MPAVQASYYYQSFKQNKVNYALRFSNIDLI